jgi:ABC-type multidrug transport system fused ATPase/permease subunit
MNGYKVITNDRILPYASLLTCYILGSGTFGMLFGFVVDRSEYYGLPAFLITVALTVCGAYLGIAYEISSSLKLFFCFLSPSIGLTMGVIAIESYLFHHSGDMDYMYYNDSKNYPSLQGINGVMCASAILYFLIILGMPFDWIFRQANSIEMYIASRNDEIKYPCDNEEEEEEGGRHSNKIDDSQYLLNVKNISQVYPDGTHAVKDMNFKIKKGEVLSFLGSNGAGKYHYSITKVITD